MRTQPKPILCYCDICGKGMVDGDRAYATTLGSVDVFADGFSMDDLEPWLTVACHDCGLKISEAINAIRA